MEEINMNSFNLYDLYEMLMSIIVATTIAITFLHKMSEVLKIQQSSCLVTATFKLQMRQP